MRAISALIRLAADGGALAGAPVAPWGALFAAMRGSALTCSGQPARPLDGARADALSVPKPRLTPRPSGVSMASRHAPLNAALHNEGAA